MTQKSVRYIVCVDQRDESHVALQLAVMKAKIRGGGVVMLHIVPPADFQTLGGVAERMREEQKNEAELFLASLAQAAWRDHGIMPQTLLCEGNIGDEIINAAMADPDVIMLVIGIAQQHPGRGSLAAWLAGQLGGKLLVPLLMVPGNLTDQQLENLV